MQHFDKDCLYSTVKNVSGFTLRFGFLPPHGAQLADAEEYIVFGNILDRLRNARQRQAFAAAIDAGIMELLKTPSPVLVDVTDGTTVMLQSASGTVTGVDPCWTMSDSLDIDVPA